ncbi:MAG: aminotransferase class I/II-fold pyridoxal phosphate-dependent enzyme [Firmicutes bacterium]|jgi:threonine aldolase|nr:aminotransferase class I/II-fold pyridoxal phosphate-dependent enzyme [Bacillota bacterium]
MSRIVDLRSDTITLPSEEMRDAMRSAVIGDDYYGDDPTVQELETLAAKKLGKEAGLFVTSGTMGNLVSILASTQRGDGIIVEADAHVYRCETGHLAAVAGVLAKRVKGHAGMFKLEDLEAALFADGVLYPPNKLLCVENTHNAAGGTCISVAHMEELRRFADAHGMLIHVDGARIFNAAIALGVPAKDLAKDADSLTFCLSKGLACPFGSLIVGDADFIRRCRKMRQMVGGGMRQAGVMAAAGIVALNKMVDRLAEDHENARVLAESLVALGLDIDLSLVQTNMVFVNAANVPGGADALVARMKENGVIVNAPSRGRFRMVTHYGITRHDIEMAIEAVKRALH